MDPLAHLPTGYRQSCRAADQAAERAGRFGWRLLGTIIGNVAGPAITHVGFVLLDGGMGIVELVDTDGTTHPHDAPTVRSISAATVDIRHRLYWELPDAVLEQAEPRGTHGWLAPLADTPLVGLDGPHLWAGGDPAGHSVDELVTIDLDPDLDSLEYTEWLLTWDDQQPTGWEPVDLAAATAPFLRPAEPA